MSDKRDLYDEAMKQLEEAYALLVKARQNHEAEVAKRAADTSSAGAADEVLRI
jgi:predicted RNase H-like HicB family nuclease